MSISTFKRHFQQIYEVAPSRWFREKRLQRAEYLLRVQHQKPSEVYREVGFENLSSFTQAFKKHFGTTPKKYQAAQH